MKLGILLLSLALTAALATGCGPSVPAEPEVTPTEMPTATPSPTPAPVIPDDPVAQRMAGLRKRDVSAVTPEQLDTEALIAALNAAAAHPAAAVTEESPLWTVSLTLKQQGTLELSAGLTEGQVTATWLGETEDQRYVVEDAPLYELVRHSADRRERIDQKALQAHESLLNRTMADALAWYVDDPAGYDSYAVTALYPVASFDPGDGTQVSFYDFRFCLTPQHPEQVRLVGAMFLDGELRVHDIAPTGWLAVRSRDGEIAAADFLGFSFQWDAADPDSIDALDALLDHAEQEAGLTVHVSYPPGTPLQDYDYFQDEVTDYNQELLFRTDRTVTDFHFFAVEYGTREERYDPREGALLYSQPELTPERLLIINTNFPGDMPYRGFSFVEDEVRKAYTLSTSGRDGSLVVAPIP